MRNVLILGAVRTAIGSMGGVFAQTSVVKLGVTAAAECLRRANVPPEQVEEAIFGNVLNAGQGQNPARQVSLGVGVPDAAPAFTVNKVCGSGLKAIELGWESIQLGRAECVLAGGMENMTMSPYLLPAMRAGARLGDTNVIDSAVRDGLWDAFNDYHMGITAENVAEMCDISREEQDQFAFESQRKCGEAAKAGRFRDEIVPVIVKQKKAEKVIEADEHPRPETTLEKMAGLPTAFRRDGTVTAGNASGINDGAAAVVLLAEEALPAGGRPAKPVYLRDVRASGCDPKVMGLGPIGAVRRLLDKNGFKKEDIGLWELNEAFAVQAIAVLRELDIDPALVNVNGGAIALGHPIGCTGARVTTTLIHEMQRRGVRYGVAAMCIGGGMGIAGLIECGG